MDINFKIHDSVAESFWPATLKNIRYIAHLNGVDSYVTWNENGKTERCKYSDEDIKKLFKDGTWVKI